MNSKAIIQPVLIFPKEFEKKPWDDIDKRYFIILFTSWLLVYTTVTILGNISYDDAAFSARARADYMEC